MTTYRWKRRANGHSPGIVRVASRDAQARASGGQAEDTPPAGRELGGTSWTRG